jgi:hypothetical protein
MGFPRLEGFTVGVKTYNDNMSKHIFTSSAFWWYPNKHRHRVGWVGGWGRWGLSRVVPPIVRIDFRIFRKAYLTNFEIIHTMTKA